MELEHIIWDLVSRRKEGDFWDFKRQYHSNPVDLVHDIVCLANTTRHKGDRYLVFGVTDDYEFCGVQDLEPRKTQADIIDVLSNANFAGGIYPDIILEERVLGAHTVEVIIISDLPEKPYYLQKGYSSGRKKLNAGTIYSRVRDRNTSKNGVASQNDIDQMWRERFGLTQTPYERFRKYILDHSNWNRENDSMYFYEPFPEFTIQRISEVQEIHASESWVRAATNHKAYFVEVAGMYHQTILWKEVLMFYDEMRCNLPDPSKCCVEFGERSGVLYYFIQNKLNFDLAIFYSRQNHSTLLGQQLPYGRMGQKMPLIFFESDAEKESFLCYVTENSDAVADSNYRIRGWAAGQYLQEENDIGIGFDLRDAFLEWKY